MADNRVVKVTLFIDETGAVRSMKTAAEQSGRTERKFRELDKGVKGLGKSFAGLKGMIVGSLGLLGAGTAAYGIKAVVDQTKEALVQTEKFSAISGTSAQQSLYLTAALKARGINSEVAGRSFAFLATNMKTAERQEHKYGQAQTAATSKHKALTAEVGKQAAAFKQLLGPQGVGALAGLTGEQKLEKVTEAFENLPEAIKKTGVQAALMKEIFGRGGTALAPVLQGGATGLKAFTDEARKFFPTIKGGQKGIEEWAVSHAKFNLAVEGTEMTLGMKLLPVLMDVQNWIAKVSLEVKKGTGFWGGLGRDISGVAQAVKDVVGWLDKMGKAFNIPVGAGGLGAALMAFAGIHTIKHPVAGAKTGAKVAKGIGNFAKGHPELAPVAAAVGAGAAIPFGTGAAIHAGVEGMFPGLLKERTVGEYERALLHPESKRMGGGGRRATLGGQAAAGAMTGGEAATLAKAIESLKPTHDEHQFTMIMNGEKVAEGLLKNPRARRILSEAVTIYAQQLNARGHR